MHSYSKKLLTSIVPGIITSKIQCIVLSNKDAKYQSMFVEGMCMR